MAKKKGLPASPFVPVEEQSYSIPENWCWIKFSSIMELISGRDAALTDCNSEGHGIPYILGASSIENNTFTIERWIETPQVISNKGDILLSVKGTIGKLYIQQEEKVNISRQIMAIRPTKILNNKLAHLFLQLVCDELREAGNGLIPGISRADVLDKPFPFMPLPEQHRIVSRIESLFAKLDEAKEKAQAVVDGFELRKSAILHKAFTGELTERWRKEHGVGLDSWTKRKLKNCGDWCGGGTPSMAHPEYWDGGDLLWITSKDMKSDIIEDTLLHTNMAGVNNSSANYIERPSVLFVMRSGILRRTLPIAMVKVPFTVNQDLKAVSPVNDLDLEYFFWVCKSAEKRMLGTCMKNGTTVESINTKTLMEFEIPVASQSEQREIVNCIIGLLDKEQQAKSAAEAVLTQIDAMKKAILARAFRGELGTNNPEEASAAEMLNTVLGE